MRTRTSSGRSAWRARRRRVTRAGCARSWPRPTTSSSWPPAAAPARSRASSRAGRARSPPQPLRRRSSDEHRDPGSHHARVAAADRVLAAAGLAGGQAGGADREHEVQLRQAAAADRSDPQGRARHRGMDDVPQAQRQRAGARGDHRGDQDIRRRHGRRDRRLRVLLVGQCARRNSAGASRHPLGLDRDRRVREDGQGDGRAVGAHLLQVPGDAASDRQSQRCGAGPTRTRDRAGNREAAAERAGIAFRPAWWLRNRHAQTVWGPFTRRDAPPSRRERVVTPDGDFGDLDWHDGPVAPGAPLLLVLHGLEGSCHSHYVRGPLQLARTAGCGAAVMGAGTFAAYDRAVTAPLHGVADERDYWRGASCRPYLARVRRPTLLISALDDPFVPPAALPSPSELSPSIVAEFTAHGGHVGFWDGPPWRPRPWAEHRAVEFLSAV